MTGADDPATLGTVTPGTIAEVDQSAATNESGLGGSLAGTDVDVDQQKVLNPGGTVRGGYSAAAAGAAPWDVPADPGYLISKGRSESPQHAYTDSSSSASSMTMRSTPGAAPP